MDFAGKWRGRVAVALLGPAGVCLSSALIVARAAGEPLSRPGFGLFLAGVITAYAIDCLADQPAGRRSRGLLISVIAAALAGFFTALYLPMHVWLISAALGVLALAYRMIKTVALLKTLAVAAAWTTASAVFPLAGEGWAKIPFSLLTALFALYAAGTLLCDFKDATQDKEQGVGSAPVLWGNGMARAAALALALTGAGCALLSGQNILAASAGVLALLTAFPGLLARPVLGPALADGILALPALLILSGLG